MMPVPDSEFDLEQDDNDDGQIRTIKQHNMGNNSTLTAQEHYYMDRNIARARAFLLNPSTNEWMDVATGTCIIMTDENAKKDYMSVAIQSEPIEGGNEQNNFNGTNQLNEANAGTIGFRTAFGVDQEITLQQDTVVSWTQPDGTDAALSFEAQDGCKEFWLALCTFQGIPSHLAQSAHEGYTTSLLKAGEDGTRLSIIMPEPIRLPGLAGKEALQDIDECLKTVITERNVTSRRYISSQILDEKYIPKLCELSKEGVEMDRLKSIIINLVLINNSGILRSLTSQEHFADILHILEHGTTREHSVYLEKQHFQDVLKFSSDVLELIHATFRLSFFKDTAAAPFFDDDVHTSLVLLVRSNHMAIIEKIEQDMDLYDHLIPLMPSSAVIEFFIEFLQIIKTVVSPKTLKIYSSPRLNEFLSKLTHEMNYHSTLILTHYAQHDVDLMRKWLISDPNLLKVLIDTFLSTSCLKLRSQLTTLLKLVCSTNMAMDRSGDTFLTLFYTEPANKLLHPLVTLDTRVRQNSPSFLFEPLEADIFRHLVDLLCFFVLQHRYRIKYLLLRTFLMQNSLLLLKSNCRVLHLGAVRVFRCMISTSDDFYFRFMIKNSCMNTLIELIDPDKDDCMQSMLLEMFDTIRTARFRTIIDHLVESHRAKFVEWIEKGGVYKRVFDGILELYDQWHSGTELTREQMLAREEEYFEKDDSEEQIKEKTKDEETTDTLPTTELYLEKDKSVIDSNEGIPMMSPIVKRAKPQLYINLKSTNIVNNADTTTITPDTGNFVKRPRNE